MATNKGKLIHIAQIRTKGYGHPTYLFLRQVEPHDYVWFQETEPGQEIETTISSDQLEEALRLARQYWQHDSFRTINCGFRYTLPERDEHGQNAFFHQMATSYSSMNGIYFDEDLGYNCIVSFASTEARDLWQRLSKNSQL